MLVGGINNAVLGFLFKKKSFKAGVTGFDARNYRKNFIVLAFWKCNFVFQNSLS